jgi:hypothetical protein
LDRDKWALDKVMERARLAESGNIERIDAPGALETGMAAECVDVVLLFDIFHRYYFPHKDDRRELLHELLRVLRPTGSLLVYPRHMESDAADEIQRAGFSLAGECWGTLVHHDRDVEQGRVLSFKKALPRQGYSVLASACQSESGTASP